MDRLRAHRFPFLEAQRAVVEARWQAEADTRPRLPFAAVVAPEHAADLGHGDMAFVGEHEDSCRAGTRRALAADRRDLRPVR